MTARTIKRLKTTATAPTARGTFEGIIEHNPPSGDKDNERIASWVNLPARVPMMYMHTYGDPGAEIGTANVLPRDERHVSVFGKLDLGDSMGRAVHERMLLPAGDERSLSELSVGFSYPSDRVQKDANGVRVIRFAELVEVSVVKYGAQSTEVRNVKTARPNEELARLNKQLDELARPVRSPDLIDLFVKAERERQKAEDEQIRAAVARTYLPAGTLLPSEAERDAQLQERFARDRERIAERQRRRDEEVAAGERADRERREAARKDPRVFTP
ncbi:MAG: HK97 family phage prohead protease [Actinomycetota bacterium]